MDTDRFRPLPQIDQSRGPGAPRAAHLPGLLVISVSRLVPRKGMDTLIEAASASRAPPPGCRVAIAGAGRDRHRLERLAAHARVTVEFLGKLADADLPDFYACADVFALCCRSRWWGLEQEGFGVVLVEAAAAGVPCITIDSGGAGEAVVDGETGLVSTWGTTVRERRPRAGKPPRAGQLSPTPWSRAVRPRPRPAHGRGGPAPSRRGAFLRHPGPAAGRCP